MMQACKLDKEESLLWAILVYALYSSTNQARARGVWLSPEEGEAAMKQNIRNGIMGHQLCTKLVEGRFLI